MIITADMLPDDCGEVVRFFFKVLYPKGATVGELKNSPHRTLRGLGKYFDKAGR